MNKVLFVDTIATILKAYGFSKNGVRFKKTFDEVTTIVDLQKSSWSNSYYVNVGFFINALIQGDPKKLKSYQGNLKARICEGTSEIVDGKPTISYAFDLDNPGCSVELIRNQTMSAMQSSVLPITSIADVEKIVQAASGAACYNGYDITSSAKAYFGLQLPNTPHVLTPTIFPRRTRGTAIE